MLILNPHFVGLLKSVSHPITFPTSLLQLRALFCVKRTSFVRPTLYNLLKQVFISLRAKSASPNTNCKRRVKAYVMSWRCCLSLFWIIAIRRILCGVWFRTIYSLSIVASICLGRGCWKSALKTLSLLRRGLKPDLKINNTFIAKTLVNTNVKNNKKTTLVLISMSSANSVETTYIFRWRSDVLQGQVKNHDTQVHCSDERRFWTGQFSTHWNGEFKRGSETERGQKFRGTRGGIDPSSCVKLL